MLNVKYSVDYPVHNPILTIDGVHDILDSQPLILLSDILFSLPAYASVDPPTGIIKSLCLSIRTAKWSSCSLHSSHR
jgi:hypothetical protein